MKTLLVLFLLIGVCYGWFHEMLEKPISTINRLKDNFKLNAKGEEIHQKIQGFRLKVKEKTEAPELDYDCDHGHTKEFVDDHKDAFALFDPDGDGITVDDIMAVQRDKMGQPVSREEAEQMLSMGDKDGDSKLTVHEWIDMQVNIALNKLDLDDLKNGFALFDKDRNMVLTEGELATVLKKEKKFKRDPEGAERAAKEIFRKFNCDGDRVLSFKEFLGFMVHNNEANRRFHGHDSD